MAAFRLLLQYLPRNYLGFVMVCAIRIGTTRPSCVLAKLVLALLKKSNTERPRQSGGVWNNSFIHCNRSENFLRYGILNIPGITFKGESGRNERVENQKILQIMLPNINTGLNLVGSWNHYTKINGQYIEFSQIHTEYLVFRLGDFD